MKDPPENKISDDKLRDELVYDVKHSAAGILVCDTAGLEKEQERKNTYMLLISHAHICG